MYHLDFNVFRGRRFGGSSSWQVGCQGRAQVAKMFRGNVIQASSSLGEPWSRGP